MVDTKVPTIIFLCYYGYGGGNMARKYTLRSKEEKLSINLLFKIFCYGKKRPPKWEQTSELVIARETVIVTCVNRDSKTDRGWKSLIVNHGEGFKYAVKGGFGHEETISD